LFLLPVLQKDSTTPLAGSWWNNFGVAQAAVFAPRGLFGFKILIGFNQFAQTALRYTHAIDVCRLRAICRVRDFCFEVAWVCHALIMQTTLTNSRLFRLILLFASSIGQTTNDGFLG
jgi:hypothetical protein